MITLGEFVMFHKLNSNGLSISELTRQLRRDRKTVRKYLHRDANDPSCVQRNARPSKLAAYERYLLERDNQFPQLSAVCLLREIRERGYDGGYTIVTDYLRDVRPLPERHFEVAGPLINVSENWGTTAFARPVEHAADRGTEHAAPQVPDMSPASTPEVTTEVAPEVTTEVLKLLQVMSEPMNRQSLQEALELKAERNFRLLYLRPAIEAELVEMTTPHRPRSSKQKYLLTKKGRLTIEKTFEVLRKFIGNLGLKNRRGPFVRASTNRRWLCLTYSRKMI